jgi:hypothetical protein
MTNNILDGDFTITKQVRTETRDMKSEGPTERFKYELQDGKSQSFTINSQYPIEGLSEGETIRLTLSAQTIQQRLG